MTTPDEWTLRRAMSYIAHLESKNADMREQMERIAFYGLDPAAQAGIDDSTLMHHYKNAAFSMVGIAARALEALK